MRQISSAALVVIYFEGRTQRQFIHDPGPGEARGPIEKEDVKVIRGDRVWDVRSLDHLRIWLEYRWPSVWFGWSGQDLRELSKARALG